jgi:hypothetical protein
MNFVSFAIAMPLACLTSYYIGRQLHQETATRVDLLVERLDEVEAKVDNLVAGNVTPALDPKGALTRAASTTCARASRSSPMCDFVRIRRTFAAQGTENA